MMNESGRSVLITGGAGFIGTNLAAHLLRDTGAKVRIFDNLSRKGVEQNLQWLTSLTNEGSRLEIVEGDIRDAAAVRAAVRGVSEIYHFAAQVAVTTSVANPVEDCEVNINGTLNVLEAARQGGRKPFLLFTSTNKVYGALPHLAFNKNKSSFAFADAACMGVDESASLDFYSPYGCSKGAADQYVRDYARIYQLPTVVFRMSCIAGPRQFGNEDQGWVAHFVYSALNGEAMTVFGDGRQVRDVLHVSDLIEAMEATRRRSEATAGQIYNVGGGTQRAVSLLEVLQTIRSKYAPEARWSFEDVRPGDQPIYVTDFRKLVAHTGWQPHRSFQEILADIHDFWKRNPSVCRPGFFTSDGSLMPREVVA